MILINVPLIPLDQVMLPLQALAVSTTVSPLQIAFLLAVIVGALPALPTVIVNGLDVLLVQVLVLHIAV